MGPQKTHPCVETRQMMYRSLKSVCGRWRSAIPSIKKEEKVAQETKTCDMSRVCRDHPRCHRATWICMCCHTRHIVIYILRFTKIRLGFLEPRGAEISHFPLTMGFYNTLHYHSSMPYYHSSVLWHCWLGGRKGIRPVEWWGAGMIICLERGADLHMAQLMPLPLTVSCFSKIQTGFTFLVPAHLGSPRQRAVKRVCVCVCMLYYRTSRDQVKVLS